MSSKDAPQKMQLLGAIKKLAIPSVFIQSGGKPPQIWPSLSPCGLSICVATSVVWSRNPKRQVAPPRVYVCICMDSAGPAWSSLAQDLYDSGRHESGICTSPSPGPWRARRLDSTVWTLVFG